MHDSRIKQPIQIFIDPNSSLPKTYFDLIQKVGSSGRYQRNLFMIFLLVFLVTGSILLSTSFVFLNDSFQCKQNGLLIQNCKKSICELKQSQRNQFRQRNDADIYSIASEFGPFQCENLIYLDVISSAPYLGSFLGFLIFSYISDNFGRRTTMIIALTIATLGCILISSGLNIPMVGIGMLFAGAGINTSSTIVFYFLGETVQNVKRQKYSILVQISYTFGALVVTGLYYFVHQWRIVAIIIQAVPAVILLGAFTYYVQQTPIFLLKKSNQQALRALNRIGYINRGIKQIVTEDDIQNVKRQQLTNEIEQNGKISPLDLIRYQSLRWKTIFTCLLCYLIFSLYYGPVLIIDSIGFNIYASSLAIQISQLIGYIPCYYLIDKIQRKKTGCLLFVVAIISSFVLSLVDKPEECQFCVESWIQLVVIFVFRFAIATEFVLFLVYIVELYPAKVTGIGIGTVSAFGTLGSTLCPIIIGVLQRLQFNVMLLFLVMAVLALGFTSLLEQTLNKPLTIQIHEIMIKKNKKKSKFKSQLYSQKGQHSQQLIYSQKQN